MSQGHDGVGSLFEKRFVGYVIFGQDVGFTEERAHFGKKCPSLDWVGGLGQPLLESG
ncbi:MAG: hypothetical protein WA175_07600 [Candidatus Acidiferrales bacterium]